MCSRLLLLVLVCLSAVATTEDVSDFDDSTPSDERLSYPEFASMDEEEDNLMNISVTDAPTPAPLILAITMLPSCDVTELLTSDGSDIFCMPIPERQCRCPGPDFDVTGGFKPPLDCPVFNPPEGGAFVCITVENGAQIYCSVVCDSMSEFSSFPLNPYACGVFTKFKWIDFFNMTYSQLPQCDGFRYSLRPVHLEENYLPRLCRDLSMVEVDQVKTMFCDMTRYFFVIQCNAEDVSIHCGR